MNVTTKTVLALIGRQKLADALGVTRNAVNKANSSGKFPAAWALKVRQLLADDGRDWRKEAPDDLFNYK